MEKKVCEVCQHDHQDPKESDEACDYMPCDECGFDHSYEQAEAHTAHAGRREGSKFWMTDRDFSLAHKMVCDGDWTGDEEVCGRCGVHVDDHYMPASGMRFNLGVICLTSGVVEALRDENLSNAEVVRSIRRHVSGDFGDIDGHDRAVNDRAARSGGRVLSAYKLECVKIWIITESDRSSTTVLLPEEY